MSTRNKSKLTQALHYQLLKQYKSTTLTNIREIGYRFKDRNNHVVEIQLSNMKAFATDINLTKRGISFLLHMRYQQNQNFQCKLLYKYQYVKDYWSWIPSNYTENHTCVVLKTVAKPIWYAYNPTTGRYRNPRLTDICPTDINDLINSPKVILLFNTSYNTINTKLIKNPVMADKKRSYEQLGDTIFQFSSSLVDAADFDKKCQSYPIIAEGNG
eukprot:74243_1